MLEGVCEMPLKMAKNCLNKNASNAIKDCKHGRNSGCTVKLE